MGGPTLVYLGNHQPIEQIVDHSAEADPETGEKPRSTVPLAGKRCTTVEVPEGTPALDVVKGLAHPSFWGAHSAADSPAWVASTSPVLAAFLAEHWGCELRDPEPASLAMGPAEVGGGSNPR